MLKISQEKEQEHQEKMLQLKQVWNEEKERISKLACRKERLDEVKKFEYQFKQIQESDCKNVFQYERTLKKLRDCNIPAENPNAHLPKLSFVVRNYLK